MRPGLSAIIIVIGVSLIPALCRAEAVSKEILFSARLSLKVPKTYTLRFSLWDSQNEGAMLWSEQKSFKMKSKKISHNLGSVDTVNNPLSPSYFSMQLWVQVDKSGKSGKWSRIGKRSKLPLHSYAFSALNIADDSVTSLNLQSNSVTSEKIQSSAVSSDKIADSAVTESKINNTFLSTLSRTTHNHDSLYLGKTAEAGGDLDGNFPSPSVVSLHGVPVSAAAPAADYVLKYDGAQWAPAPEAGNPYARTIIVSPVGTSSENGTALFNALENITDATNDKRYLLKIEPGIYELGSLSLNMKSYVDVEGSGEESTTIQAGGGSSFSDATVIMVSNSSLRDLRVLSNSSSTYGIGISVTSVSSAGIRNVRAAASGGSSVCRGIHIQSSTGTRLENVKAEASGGANGYGLLISGGDQTLIVNGSYLTSSGNSSANAGLHITQSSTAIIMNSEARGDGGAGTTAEGIHISSSSSPEIINSKSYAKGSNLCYGVYMSDGSPELLHHTSTSACTGSGYGIYAFSGASPVIQHSIFKAAGGTNTAGAFFTGSGSPSLDFVYAEGSGGTTNNAGIQVATTGSFTGRNITATGSGGDGNIYGMSMTAVSGHYHNIYAKAVAGTNGSAFGLLLSSSTNPSFSNITAITSSGTSGSAVYITTSSATFDNLHAKASDASSNIGLYTYAGSSSYTVKIRASKIESSTTTISNNSHYTTYVAATELDGTSLANSGTLNCIYTYDESNTALGAACS